MISADLLNLNVLIVEDEELLLRAISKKMEVMGIRCVSCTTALQALDYLENLPDLPDAIWLDYYLKDMNGLEFMMRLKGDTRFSQIPVMVVSNSASDDKVKSMLGLGVNKYMLKAQYKLEDLILCIKDLVSDGKEGTN